MEDEQKFLEELTEKILDRGLEPADPISDSGVTPEEAVLRFARSYLESDNSDLCEYRFF